ncbi:XRE family transcriptional regulator [Bacteroides bouchesdurhonensis]|uniref:XRE family transcriptional regulator n=1 Tax=Bacteroides bouchesdurhonensis TaxID=1841855 RepID=UPI0022E0C4EC|nr:XRE family transcriptional regulator [Bacteroides bouchesdurhonensis]
MITRIKEVIAYYDLSTRAFAMKCGLKDNTFSNQLNGMRELSLTTISAILLSNEEISAEWLIRGKGDMLIQKQETEPSLEKLKSIVYTIANLQDEINEKTMQAQRLLEENQKLKGELAMLKNERNIG